MKDCTTMTVHDSDNHSSLEFTGSLNAVHCLLAQTRLPQLAWFVANDEHQRTYEVYFKSKGPFCHKKNKGGCEKKFLLTVIIFYVPTFPFYIFTIQFQRICNATQTSLNSLHRYLPSGNRTGRQRQSWVPRPF